MAPHKTSARRVAAAVGLGLRAPHVREVLSTRPRIGWFEIHAENYFSGGPALAQLDAIRRDYPVSLHGVGLSLGSADGLSGAQLARLAELVRRSEPFLVSEHLSWSVADGAYLNDLLPLPYTEEALDVVAGNIDRTQETLGRRILVENPSRYLSYRHSTIAEPEFLNALVRRTGCGILCDVNNIFVNSRNLGFDAARYIASLDPAAIGEIHLAGHSRCERGGRTILIDDHGSEVTVLVWALYHLAIERFGLVPSLIEWDTDIPDFATLLAEARRAERAAQDSLVRDAQPA
jgi:uncharacterized protein (UPF0276 family)